VKLAAPAYRRQAQRGASGKGRYDYKVGFPPRPCSRKAGHPAGLPVTISEREGSDDERSTSETFVRAISS